MLFTPDALIVILAFSFLYGFVSEAVKRMQWEAENCVCVCLCVSHSFFPPTLRPTKEVPNRQTNWLERRANIYKQSLRGCVSSTVYRSASEADYPANLENLSYLD